jgi:hypothetical protein
MLKSDSIVRAFLVSIQRMASARAAGAKGFCNSPESSIIETISPASSKYRVTFLSAYQAEF